MAGAKGVRPWNYGISSPRHLPTEIPTELDIAWAAGIYEGEGTCNAHVYTDRGKNRRPSAYRVLRASVSQKDPWLCYRLRELFGGVVRETCTRVSGSDERRIYYRWDTYGTRTIAFLRLIQSYLSPRRKAQVQIVLDAVPASQVRAEETI